MVIKVPSVSWKQWAEVNGTKRIIVDCDLLVVADGEIADRCSNRQTDTTIVNCDLVNPDSKIVYIYPYGKQLNHIIRINNLVFFNFLAEIIPHPKRSTDTSGISELTFSANLYNFRVDTLEMRLDYPDEIKRQYWEVRKD